MDELAHSSHDEHLSETVKAHQRADLLALASSMSSSEPVSSATSASPKIPQRSRRILWLAGAFAVTVLALNLVLSALPGQNTDKQLSRILVPAAQSAQAFSLQPTKITPAGMDLTQGWVLQSSVHVPSVTKELLEKSVRIDPPVAIRVEPATDVQAVSDTQAWRIIPTSPLAQDTVYRVTLATTLQSDAKESSYEYSWVSQTIGSFSIESLTPGPGTMYVPTDTAFEWVFSRAGFANPTSSIEFVPPISGHFETRDRSLVFLPDRPLVVGKAYRVTLKAGFGVPGAEGMQLSKDFTYGFQIESDYRDPSTSYHDLLLPVQTQVATGKPLKIVMSADAANESKMTVDGYALTTDEVEKYLDIRSSRYGVFEWSGAQRGDVAPLTQGKTPVFHLVNQSAVMERTDAYGSLQGAISVPAKPAGAYLVHVTSSRTDDYTLVQVSDLAVNLLGDHERALFWVMNANTRQPVSGATIQLGSMNGTTSADGLATVSFPAGFNDVQNVLPSWMTARVSNQNQTTVLEVGPMAFPMSFYWGGMDPYEGLRRTWAYVYVDRGTQRQTDTINIYGLATDRATKQAATNLTLRVTQSSGYSGYLRSMAPLTLDEQKVAPDASGRFQASFSWKNRQTGSYSIELLRDNKVVTTGYFEIRAEQKPRMLVSLTMDQPNAYMGDTVTGQVRTTFVDGTLFPGADVQILADQGGAQVFDQVVHTNDQGVGTFRINTNRVVACHIGSSTAYSFMEGDCNNTGYMNVSALSRTGDQAESSAQGNVMLYQGQAIFHGQNSAPYSWPEFRMISSQRIQVTGSIFAVAGVGAVDEQSTPAPGQTVTAEIIRRDARQVQTGTQYDEQQKRTMPVFEERYTIVSEGKQAVPVDAQGRFDLLVTTQSTSSQYTVMLQTMDGRGRVVSVSQAIYPLYDNGPGAVSGNASAGQAVVPDHFELVGRNDPSGNDTSSYIGDADLFQRLSFRVNVNEKPLDVAKYSRPLFVIASRGIKSSVVSADANTSFVFDENIYPNLTLYAVVFTDHGFEAVQGSVAVKHEPYRLKLDVTTDKETYTPSSTAQVRIKVRGAENESVGGVKVAVSVADNALAPLNAFSDADPVDSVYGYTDGDIQEQVSTHQAAKSMYSGAEGGGGGGDASLFDGARKNFKDQAAFVIVETDANGDATADVRLPDNITTWRIQAIGLSKDLRAGTTILTRPATKTIAIDAVVPPMLYVGDQAQIKLRPIAQQLGSNTDVEYVVNAPTLGLNRQSVHGKGHASVYVPLSVTAAMVGTHTVQVALIADGHQDAMEFPVQIADKIYTKTIWEQADAVAGFKLPETLAPESSVVLTSPERSALLAELQPFIWQEGSARLESMIAAKQALETVKTLDPSNKQNVSDVRWSDYQDGGFLRPLPQSGGALDTTFKVVLSGKTGFDTRSVARSMDQMLRQASSTREGLLKAAGTLAVLGKPTVGYLQTASQDATLSWQEQAVLLRTFVALNDRADAQMLFSAWMTKSQTQDGTTFVNVSASDRARYEATRIAALVAEYLQDDRASTLHAYLARTNIDQPMFDPLLDETTLTLRVKHAPDNAVKVTYQIGDQTAEADLKNGPYLLPLTGEAWKRFSIVKVDGGKASVQWSRRVPGSPEKSDRIAIQRSYRAVSGTGPIKEGDSVVVTLKPTFTSRDTYACYEVRDTLPANLRPIIDWSFAGDAWTPARDDNGELRFTACSSYQTDITYRAQVIVPGTYTAPAPVMQNIETPSLATVGNEGQLTTVPR